MFFFLLIDTTIVNSWIIYSNLSFRFLKEPVTHLSYQLQLAVSGREERARENPRGIWLRLNDQIAWEIGLVFNSCDLQIFKSSPSSLSCNGSNRFG